MSSNFYNLKMKIENNILESFKRTEESERELLTLQSQARRERVITGVI